MSWCGLLLLSLVAQADGGAEASASAIAIPANRTWDVLPDPGESASYDDYRPVLARAGELLGEWRIHLAGLTLDGPTLVALTEGPSDEPFLRHVREQLRRPIDLVDLALFLDDVLRAGDAGLRGSVVWVPSGRARSAGITVHPDDVFTRRPRLYGEAAQINIDKPKRPADLPPAQDGDLLGPAWSGRFRNPGSAHDMLAALERENRSGSYAARVRALRGQLEGQGADFLLFSTVRNRYRGYLMWGAFLLSRLESARPVRDALNRLRRRNREWGLRIPIAWSHPEGWEKTVALAREMADAFDVVYATEQGARNSNHYEGNAVDFTGMALPRSFSLTAPDGAEHTFDLSHPEHPRDINLSPEIIAWVEEHFQMRKLKDDYPHWDDAAPAPALAATPTR